jgi:thioesterase DpgC
VTAVAVAAVDGWVRSAPVLSEEFDLDVRVVERYIGQGEEILAALPGRPARDPGQQRVADDVHRECRRLRARFVAVHAQELYDRLTESGRTRRRPVDLAAGAARLVPGLVPDPRQIAAERRLRQRDKEGREIDQGVLFWGLLRAPEAGRHLIESCLAPTIAALDVLGRFRSAGSVELDTVCVVRDGAVGRVTLANRHCLNAEDDALARDLETAVDLVLLDDQIRVCVLRGARMTHPRYTGRRVFCAGINLTDLYRGQISFVEFLLGRELGPLNKIVRGLRVDDEPGPRGGPAKPWIGVVDGFAIGGGMQVLLTLDRVVAENRAYFRLPAAQEGIVPGTANLRLTRTVGARPARALLAGRTLSAGSPDARYLCDDAVPEGEVDEAVERAVSELDSAAAVSNRRLLHLAEEPMDLFREYLALFSWEQSRRVYSEDVLTNLERRWMSRRRG